MTVPAQTTVARLRDAVRESGSPLAASLGEEPRPDTGPPGRGGPGADPAVVAASGPRVEAHREDVEVAVAAVHEGYRLHYATPRALPIDDPDLALLAGDRLYALGLARLASIGDMTAIAELADVIALSAQAHAEGEDGRAAAAWDAGAAAIASGRP